MDEEQKFLAEHGLEPSDLQVREDHESLLAKKMPEMRGPTLLEAVLSLCRCFSAVHRC